MCVCVCVCVCACVSVCVCVVSGAAKYHYQTSSKSNKSTERTWPEAISIKIEFKVEDITRSSSSNQRGA